MCVCVEERGWGGGSVLQIDKEKFEVLILCEWEMGASES